MKVNKVLFISAALICALALCTEASFADEKTPENDVKQVEENTPKKDAPSEKQKEKTTDQPAQEFPKKKERTLFDDDFINLL